MLNLIFASDLLGNIGYIHNGIHYLCFNFKLDMLNFKKLTTESENNTSSQIDVGHINKLNILIVGYNTYETIKNIKLNNRILWVLSTKDNLENTENTIFYNSFSKLINNYTKISENNNFWVIGGKQIYELFESFADNIYHTSINAIFYTNNDPIELVKYNIPSYYENVCLDVEPIKDICRIKQKECELKFNKYINKFSKSLKGVNSSYKMNIFNGEYQYLNMLYKTLNSNKRITRNGFTYSYFGDQIRFDLRNGFPLLTTKKMFFKGIVHELLFFLRGSTNTKELEEVGVNIWKGNTNRSFLDANGFTERNEGDMGPMYGYQWRYFNGEQDQLMNVINEIKTNPNSRRLLLTTYNPLQVHLGVLYPCHSLIIQFYIEQLDDSKYYLSLQMYQRSCDILLGCPFNIASMGLFLEILCNYLSDDKITYISKDIIISLGDIHLYEQHIEQSIEQLKRKPLNLCKLKILKKYDKIDDYKYEDIKLMDYYSYSSIKAEMIA